MDISIESRAFGPWGLNPPTREGGRWMLWVQGNGHVFAHATAAELIQLRDKLLEHFPTSPAATASAAGETQAEPEPSADQGDESP